MPNNSCLQNSSARKKKKKSKYSQQRHNNDFWSNSPGKISVVLMCHKATSSVSPLSLLQVVENATQVKPGGETDALIERLLFYFFKPGMGWSRNAQFSVILVAMGPNAEDNPGKNDNVD